MEKSEEESKLSLQDRVSPPVTPGEPVRSQDRDSEESERRPGLEDDRQEIQGGEEETKAVLLPVNPHLVHVYWEISARDLEGIGEAFSRLGPRAQPVLRFYDTAQAELESVNSARPFEVPIALSAGKWYVRLEHPAKSYCIDLGLRLPGGAFRRLARSNVAEMPKACPSDRLEERFLFEGDDSSEGAVVPPGGDVSGTRKASTHDEPQGAQGRLGEFVEATRTMLAYAGPQSRGVNRPERGAVSEPVPLYAGHSGREGNVAADQRVSPGRPPYADSEGDGDSDQQLGGTRQFRAPLPEEVERQLTEFYEQRRRDWVWWGPAVKGREESQAAKSECADLTEMSERSFRAGLSSGQKLP